MTVTLELKPEVEASLNHQARAKGIPLHACLQDLIDGLAGPPAVREPDVQEFRAALDRLAEMGKNLPPVPSSAFGCESIYRDHD